MYSGDNKTALSSQAAFADALVRLLHCSPYADISVSQLCQESGLSRQTFYALFGSMDNVLRYAILHSSYVPPAICGMGDPARAIARIFSDYVQANCAFLRLLVQNDLLHIFYSCCISTFSENWELPASQEPESYLQVYLSSVLSGIVSAYVIREHASSESLEEIIYSLLSGNCFRGA